MKSLTLRTEDLMKKVKITVCLVPLTRWQKLRQTAALWLVQLARKISLAEIEVKHSRR